MVLPTVLILLLSWAAGLGGETRPRAAAERRPGRAQRRGAGPRVSGLLSFCQLSQLASADPEPRSPHAIVPRAPRPRSRRRRPEQAAEPPGQAFPAPTAGRPYQPSFSRRLPGSRGAQASRPRALPQPPQPCPGPSPRTAQTRGNLRGWQRGACIVLEASERTQRSGADRSRVSGVGVRVPLGCLPSPSCWVRSVCSQRGVCVSPLPECVCVCVLCRPGARL